jgi:CRP-like cAMP-binding protein
LAAQVPLFADLDEAALDRLGKELVPKLYRKGATILVTGEPGTSLFVVNTGLVKLVLSSPSGREVILDVLGPGEVFGELAVLDGEPRSADAVAVQTSELYLLDRQAFLRVLRERPEIAINLLGVLSRRLRRDAQVVHDAAFLDVPARLARTILRLASPDPTGRLRTPRLTQSDLAGVVGTARQTLNKWLGVFIQEGSIAWYEGQITVLEAESLRRREDREG